MKNNLLPTISKRNLIKEELNKGETITTEKIVQNDLSLQVLEESQIIIHCSLSLNMNCHVRLWRTIYLFDKNSTHKSKLLHARGINIYPAAPVVVSSGSGFNFTLYFSGLPKECKTFDLCEFSDMDVFSFYASSINRSSTDVYNVEISIKGFR